MICLPKLPHSNWRWFPRRLAACLSHVLLVCCLVHAPGVDAGAVCLQVWDPVCGCNGQTYSNSCTAASAGVTCIAYKGVCGSPVPDTTPPNTTITERPSESATTTSATFGFTSTEPGSVFFCQFNGGTWSSCLSPVVYAGLTGGSYTFSVKARDPAGNEDPTPASYAWTVAVPPTACTTNPECGSGYYCFKPTGSCNGSGICNTWNPTGYCFLVVDPVCGCNGLTYNNTCEAAKAGVSLAYKRACGDSIARVSETPYMTIAEAYASVSNGNSLQLKSMELIEDIIFDRPVDLLLEGGWDSGFTTCYGMTKIGGSIVVATGSITMGNITIM